MEEGSKIRELSKAGPKHPVRTMFLIMAVGVAAGLLLIWDYPVGTIEITIDYGQLQPEYSVRPVWNTLNIWDISFLNGSRAEFNSTTYPTKYFFVDHLNLMTATGGRPSQTNEYYFEDQNGVPYYDFDQLLKAVDWIVAADLRATIVIGNVPLQMAAEAEIDFGAFDANTGVPKDYQKYYDYIANLTQAVIIHLESEIGRFYWRIMTEPDNEDWLKAPSLENYFPIYVTSVRAIRAVLPNATIELGNMMTADANKALVPFVQRLIAEAPDTLPNRVGFSGYGRGQFGDDAREIGDAGSQWYRALQRELGLYNIRVSIEEGQILADENGTRLWSGDGTEFGAAWNAGVFHECILHQIDWYAQWEFYSVEVPGPSLNVIRMYEMMEGETLVKSDVIYRIGTKEHLRRLGGFGSLSSGTIDSPKGHFLMYFSDPNHYSTQKYHVKIVLKNVPVGWQMDNTSLYLVDHSHSNFFWDQFAIFGSVPRVENSEGPTSIWDLAVPITISGTPQEMDYYVWSWENRNNYGLESVMSHAFTASSEGWTLEMDVPVNSVYQWEFKIV